DGDADTNSAPQSEIVFSAKFACPQCGYSLTELEPRLFSFNNPIGACSTCDGLGIKQFFDQSRVVAHPELSLAGGAVRGWDRRNAYYFQMISSLADHYEFDIETPFEELSVEHQGIILHGSGKEIIEFEYFNERGGITRREHAFEGIITNMNRRYHETESNVVREELSKYMSIQTCPDCEGARLNNAARHVFIQDKTISEITAMPIDHAQEFFAQLKLPGKQGEIAEKINKEVTERLNFLVNVGLDYLSLERSADTLSGGEAQRIRLASQIGAGLVGVLYVLDEPSIGLHQRDNQRLLTTLNYLRDLGNTVIVVEHDEEAIRTADYIVDIGPGAGVHGGEIVFSGRVKDLLKSKKSLTGGYLAGRLSIDVPGKRRRLPAKKKWLRVAGAKANNLKDITA
ncbi:MAG: excinuclease ABC subunit UvrA, partial [Gammaproteobacteria bacterium]|nr:excinuclease ABC subunit UvrA [Gammaproteobacteria bacterium]